MDRAVTQLNDAFRFLWTCWWNRCGGENQGWPRWLGGPQLAHAIWNIKGAPYLGLPNTGAKLDKAQPGWISAPTHIPLVQHWQLKRLQEEQRIVCSERLSHLPKAMQGVDFCLKSIWLQGISNWFRLRIRRYKKAWKGVECRQREAPQQAGGARRRYSGEMGKDAQCASSPGHDWKHTEQ